MTVISVRDILGEHGTGFEKRGNKGPFECANCHYMQHGCSHPQMIERSRQPLLGNGHREVHNEDCCEFVDRIGKGLVQRQSQRGERS